MVVRALARLAAAAGVVALGVVGTAVPALAAGPSTIESGTLEFPVPDENGIVTGGTIGGATGEVFDFQGRMDISVDGGENYNRFVDPTPVVATPSPGVTTVTYQYDAGDSVIVDLVITLRANTLTWHYTFTGSVGDVGFWFAGLNDANGQWEQLHVAEGAGTANGGASKTSWYVSADVAGGPVLGHMYVYTPEVDRTFWVDKADDGVQFANGWRATEFEYTVAVMDPGACGLHDAIEAMTAIAPTLTNPSAVGAFDPPGHECEVSAAPTTVVAGVAVDETVPLTLSADLEAELAWWLVPGAAPGDPGLNVPVPARNSQSWLGPVADGEVTGLPAGLSGTIVYGSDGVPTGVHLTGTPTTTGEATATVTLRLRSSGPDWATASWAEVSGDLEVTVTGGSAGGGSSAPRASTTSSAATPKATASLAATGAEGTPLALVAAGLLAAGAVVLTGRRLARR